MLFLTRDARAVPDVIPPLLAGSNILLSNPRAVIETKFSLDRTDLALSALVRSGYALASGLRRRGIKCRTPTNDKQFGPGAERDARQPCVFVCPGGRPGVCPGHHVSRETLNEFSCRPGSDHNAQ